MNKIKIVVFEDKYRENNTRDVIRKVYNTESINHFIREKLMKVNFVEDDIIIRKSHEQIRIPEEEYVKLKDEVKIALRKESEKPKLIGVYELKDKQERLLKDNYWSNCHAYIFNFVVYTIEIGIEWGYEGTEDIRERIEIMEFKHPFIAEFISCVETRWGEAREKQNIKKWYK